MSGPLPLTFSDIREYCELVGWRSADAIMFFADIMAAMDSVYMPYMAHQLKVRQQKEKQRQAAKAKRSRR